MTDSNDPRRKSAPVPIFVPRFWMLILQTIIMKLTHRLRGDGAYTDHLMKFYTRSETANVEVYGDAYASIRQDMVKAVSLQHGDRVLDVATGGGHQAAAFARAGHHTTGLDYVPDRARLARENHGIHTLQWGAGDASRLPFADNSFDVVTISLALHDMPEAVQRNALTEFRRVARRRVVIIEPRAPERNRILRWLYIMLGNLVDESLHFGEYVQRDFDTHLGEAGLTLHQRQRVFHGLLAIYVCTPA